MQYSLCCRSNESLPSGVVPSVDVETGVVVDGPAVEVVVSVNRNNHPRNGNRVELVTVLSAYIDPFAFKPI